MSNVPNNKDSKTNIFKNYSKKIQQKIVGFEEFYIMKAEDLNNLIVLLNWCFHTHNDFFVTDFNRKYIGNVIQTYNQLKTNIISYKELDVFNHLTKKNLNLLKFILYQYINQYDALTDDFHKELVETVSKDSIQRCINQIKLYLKTKEDVLM